MKKKIYTYIYIFLKGVKQHRAAPSSPPHPDPKGRPLTGSADGGGGSADGGGSAGGGSAGAGLRRAPGPPPGHAHPAREGAARRAAIGPGGGVGGGLPAQDGGRPREEGARRGEGSV